MISYYAYYNHGGYKDFFLGTSEDTVESKYFLPMLGVYESDESMKDKVAKWKALPSIVFLSNQTEELNYPPLARVMMSHAGYKIQYRIIGDKDILALRDIGGNKDAYGRFCPFVMMFIADSDVDKKRMEAFAFYIWNNLQTSELFFSNLFVSDLDVNGLRFDIKSMNVFFESVVSLQQGTIEENKYHRIVPFYVVSDGLGSLDRALAEQQLEKKDVAVAYNESKTLVYRYSPPQVYYGGPGVPPIVIEVSQEDSVEEEHHPEPKRNSWYSIFGLSKEEEVKALFESHMKLQNRVDELEKKITEIQNSISYITNK